MQDSKPLSPKLHVHIADTGKVAAGPIEAGDETNPDRVCTATKDDRNGRSRGFGRERRRDVSRCDDDGHPSADQIGRQFRQSSGFVLSPAILDRQAPTLNVTGLAQSYAESRNDIGTFLWRRGIEKTDHRCRRLLRPRGQRPCNYNAAEKRDEFPPPHGIYSRGREPPACKTNTIFERELCTALQQNGRADVAFGSKDDMTGRIC